MTLVYTHLLVISKSRGAPVARAKTHATGAQNHAQIMHDSFSALPRVTC